MFLAVMWVMTAAMVGFSLGRVSMYGQVVCEEGVNPGTGNGEEGQSGQTGHTSQTGHADETGHAGRTDHTSQTGRTNQTGHADQTGHTGHAGQADRAGRLARAGHAGSRLSFRKKGRRGEEDSVFWSVGSPVSGEVTAQREGERPAVMIRPDGDRLYAPAGGKITRIFPTGNAFLFSTEFGAELYIQAGEVNDELMVRHYRPRILQNEVVGKGKLLLEFDRTGLEAEGISTEVSVSVEHSPFGGSIRMNVGESVKTGEEILQVRGA